MASTPSPKTTITKSVVVRPGAGTATIRRLKFVYYSTGNPGLWSPGYRCGEKPLNRKCNSGKWDNKWSMTIFARKADTGEAVWAFQMTPFDQWDYDGINENILVDMPNVDGKAARLSSTSTVTALRTSWIARDGTVLRATNM